MFNFDEIVSTLQSECKPFLNELKFCEGFLYRGQFSHTIPDIDRIKPRIDRKPLNTPREIHDIWDGEFKKKFGWKARSEGVFVTSDSYMSENFGRAYLFFPIGPYKYVWSSKYMDVTNDMDNIVYEYFYNKERGYDTTLKKIWYMENIKHQDIWDNTEIFNEWKSKNADRIDKEMIHDCKLIVDDYIKSNMKGAIKYGNEMAFK
jgi:hypothetical protein